MSQTYSPDPPPSSRIRRALLAVWAALTAAALVYAWSFGLNAPLIDEWEFVPVLLGQEPAAPWLWAQHNEHRLPLPRAVFLGLFRLTHDFRAGMLLQVAVLSALALGLMHLAARLRGRPDWPDLFFPVSLLHLGHWENFLLGYQICFVLFCVFATGLAVVALRATRESAFRAGVEGGVLLLLAEMTGGSGLVLVPPVAAWLVYLAVVVWKGGRRPEALALVAIAGLALAYLAVYYASYQPPPDHPPPSRDPLAVGAIAGQVLAMGLGFGLAQAWAAVFAAELVLGLATVALLLHRAKDPENRPAAIGLIAVAAGLAGVAMAVGVGRAAMGPEMGLWGRYAMQSWPLLAAASLAWLKFGPGTATSGLRKWVPALLCLAAALAFMPNTGSGMAVGAAARARNTAMATDARSGVPPAEITRRHFPNSRDQGQEERAERYIPLLRDANVGIHASNGDTGGRWWPVVLLASVVLFVLAARWVWHLAKAVQAERARELFRLQHERYEEQLLKAAGASGLPRGLRWVKCAITGDAVLVRDAEHGGIVALVPVLIEFEPEADSDMAENPAAREPRPATAVFTFAGGTWETAGRVVFNHTPDQTVAAFGPQFRVIHHGHH